MVRILLTFWIFSGAFAIAGESLEPYYDLLARKAIDDFQNGIREYNTEKEPSAPEIKKRKSRFYGFDLGKNEVRFSVINFLQNKVSINGKTHPFNAKTLSQITDKKTTWIDSFIETAKAEEGNPDAEATKTILATLGALTSNLDKIGMTCIIDRCKNEKKDKNLQSILATLEFQSAKCNEQTQGQEKSIKIVTNFPEKLELLHSIADPEFSEVKKFFVTASSLNMKEVNKFMENNLNLEIGKNYQGCVDVMLSGTLADSTASNFSRGIIYSKSVGINSGKEGSEITEKLVGTAKAVCLKIDQLKNCTLALRDNLGTINSIKRNRKNIDPLFKPETLPEIKVLAK